MDGTEIMEMNDDMDAPQRLAVAPHVIASVHDLQESADMSPMEQESSATNQLDHISRLSLQSEIRGRQLSDCDNCQSCDSCSPGQAQQTNGDGHCPTVTENSGNLISSRRRRGRHGPWPAHRGCGRRRKDRHRPARHRSSQQPCLDRRLCRPTRGAAVARVRSDR